MEPLVSVIIPTHDRPQLLARAIRSVVAQTFKDWELIVVQNGPDNGAKDVMEGFRAQGVSIRYFYEAKADPCHARNVGILASQAKYIAFLDDDDEWLPGKLERKVQVAESDSGIGLVACRGFRVNAEGLIQEEIPRNFRGNPTRADLIAAG